MHQDVRWHPAARRRQPFRRGGDDRGGLVSVERLGGQIGTGDLGDDDAATELPTDVYDCRRRYGNATARTVNFTPAADCRIELTATLEACARGRRRGALRLVVRVGRRRADTFVVGFLATTQRPRATFTAPWRLRRSAGVALAFALEDGAAGRRPGPAVCLSPPPAAHGGEKRAPQPPGASRPGHGRHRARRHDLHRRASGRGTRPRAAPRSSALRPLSQRVDLATGQVVRLDRRCRPTTSCRPGRDATAAGGAAHVTAPRSTRASASRRRREAVVSEPCHGLMASSTPRSRGEQPGLAWWRWRRRQLLSGLPSTVSYTLADNTRPELHARAIRVRRAAGGARRCRRATTTPRRSSSRSRPPPRRAARRRPVDVVTPDPNNRQQATRRCQPTRPIRPSKATTSPSTTAAVPAAAGWTSTRRSTPGTSSPSWAERGAPHRVEQPDKRAWSCSRSATPPETARRHAGPGRDAAARRDQAPSATRRGVKRSARAGGQTATTSEGLYPMNIPDRKLALGVAHALRAAGPRLLPCSACCRRISRPRFSTGGLPASRVPAVIGLAFIAARVISQPKVGP